MTISNLKLSASKFPNFSKTINFLLLIIALIALSFTAIFIKFSVSEISANATVFNRLWIATIIFSLWNGIQQIKPKSPQYSGEIKPLFTYTKKGVLLLIMVAVVHIAGRFLWTWSLTQTSAANATVLSNITPFFTTLGGWLFLKQYFDRRFLTGLMLALIGVIALGYDDFLISTNGLIGDLAALCSAMFYSASFLLIEKLRNQFSSSTILTWRCFLGNIFIIPVVLTFDTQIFPISPLGWCAVIGLALISEAIGHGLVVYSLKHFSSGFVSLFMLLEPFITAVLAWFIFAEKLGIFNCLAFVIIMLGIYLAKTGKGAEKVE